MTIQKCQKMRHQVAFKLEGGAKMSSDKNPKANILKLLEKGKVLDQYVVDITGKINGILTDSYNSDRKSLIYYIELGQILLEAKICLGTQFTEKIVKAGVLPAKQVQRYIKLILTSESIEGSESITGYSKCKTSEQFAALKLDERVTKLKTAKDIEKLTDPTQAKISRMKSLLTDVKDDDEKSVDYFAQVIAGDDKIYDDSKNFIKSTTTTPSQKEPNKDKMPASMEEARFKELYNTDMYDVIKMLHKAEKKAKKSGEEELAALSAAKDHRIKLDVEKKKTKNEKQRREKAEKELNRITGAANRAKSPIDQQSKSIRG
jgi:hypothetical protein